jgi:hypothetical protein
MTTALGSGMQEPRPRAVEPDAGEEEPQGA